MAKSRWMVTARGKTFAMVGERCTYAEALAYAQSIWPGAEIA